MAVPPGSLLRAFGKLLLIPAAALLGFAAAAVVARQTSSAWTPPDTKDEVVPARKPLEIPSLRGGASIRGIVVAEDGRPVAKAKVRVSAGFLSIDTASDDLGRFTAGDLPNDPVTVTAQAAGHRPGLAGPFAPNAKEVTVRLAAAEAPSTRPAAGRGTGALVVAATVEGSPRAPRLAIAAVPENAETAGGALLARTADLDPANPTLRFDALPAGRWRVLALRRGGSLDRRLAFGEAVVEVAELQESRATLPVRCAVLEGRVLDQGSPVDRALVRVVRRRAAGTGFEPLEVELARAPTDGSGTFRILDLPEGDAVLEIRAAARAVWSGTVAIAANAPALSIDLARER